MTSSGPRFCPRCGTARVGEMAFCPNCGLDLGQLPADAGAHDQPAVRHDTSPAVPRVAAPPNAGARYATLREQPGLGRFLGPGLLVVLLLLVAISWLAGLGPFARPGGGGGPLTGGDTESATPSSPFLPAVTAQPSFSIAPGLTAPPVGLTILSPADGAVVGAKEVTVIGTAPPGLRITQDISLGFDRHATADGTGHWAIGLELSEGENQLKFRIGDDPSTTQTIRVFYLAPAS